MAVVEGEGADKTQLENGLVQFGVEYFLEPFQEGCAVVVLGKLALHVVVDHLCTSFFTAPSVSPCSSSHPYITGQRGAKCIPVRSSSRSPRVCTWRISSHSST